MKVIITAILIVLLFISPSHAENIYIGEQAQGYDSGTDCLNRHSVAWFNNASNWGAVAGKIKAGDTIHLCGTINSPMIVNGSGMSGSPITILWERDAKLSRPTWSSGTGFITASNKSFIILDGGTNGILEATDNGTTAAFGGTKNYANDIYGIFFDNCISCEIRNLTIRGIYDRKAGSTDCIRAGKPIYWAGNLSGGAIHGNTVSDGFRCLFLPFTGTSTNGFNVYSNIIANCSVAINPAPSSETGHSAKNISIYSNTITGGNKWDGEFDSQCQAKGCSSSCLTDRWHHQDGIHAFAFSGSITDGLKIFSNYLQDFGTHSTAHIYIEGAGMTNTMIYNNVLVTTGDNYAANGDVAIKAATGTKVYNNTFVGNNRGAAVLIHSGAQNSDIKNNIIRNLYTGIYLDDTSSIVSNFNCFYGINNWYFRGRLYYSLSNWQSLGYDSYSIGSDPILNASYKLTPSSPLFARQGGVNLSSVFTTDKDGTARGTVGGWSLGAYVYDGSYSGLLPPSGFRVVY